MGRIGGGGFRRMGGGGGGRAFGPRHRELLTSSRLGGGGGFRRVRMGFHRVGFRARLANRRMHRHTLFRTYFRGRRIRHFWGPPGLGLGLGLYAPLPFYETAAFRAEFASLQADPTVQPRTLTVTLVPFAASVAFLPPNVAPGQVFQFTPPGDTRKYLVAAPANAGSNVPVELMIPPATVPASTDRVDVLVNLFATPGSTDPAPSIDTDGDGVPDAAAFIPGQDAYLTVLADQGNPDNVIVHIPATSALTLKHVVDALESWGEAALALRTQNDATVVDSTFTIDMVQVGAEGKGPRWEHEQFLGQEVTVSPRVVVVTVPDGCNAGDTFDVGTDITGSVEALQVRVPEGVAAGEALEVVVPDDATIPLAQQLVPPTGTTPDDSKAWSSPEGFDFYSSLEEASFQISVGVVEVTVRSTSSLEDNTRRTCVGVVSVIVFVVVLATIIAVAVLASKNGGRQYVTGYRPGEYCSTYYSLTPACDDCPTVPTDSTKRICWDDTSYTWSALSSSQKTYWTTLGYTSSMWNSGGTPPSVNECFADLPLSMQAAAQNLGFTASLWNYPYKC